MASCTQLRHGPNCSQVSASTAASLHALCMVASAAGVPTTLSFQQGYTNTHLLACNASHVHSPATFLLCHSLKRCLAEAALKAVRCWVQLDSGGSSTGCAAGEHNWLAQQRRPANRVYCRGGSRAANACTGYAGSGHVDCSFANKTYPVSVCQQRQSGSSRSSVCWPCYPAASKGDMPNT